MALVPKEDTFNPNNGNDDFTPIVDDRDNDEYEDLIVPKENTITTATISLKFGIAGVSTEYACNKIVYTLYKDNSAVAGYTNVQLPADYTINSGICRFLLVEESGTYYVTATATDSNLNSSPVTSGRISVTTGSFDTNEIEINFLPIYNITISIDNSNLDSLSALTVNSNIKIYNGLPRPNGTYNYNLIAWNDPSTSLLYKAALLSPTFTLKAEVNNEFSIFTKTITPVFNSNNPIVISFTKLVTYDYEYYIVAEEVDFNGNKIREHIPYKLDVTLSSSDSTNNINVIQTDEYILVKSSNESTLVDFSMDNADYAFYTNTSNANFSLDTPDLTYTIKLIQRCHTLILQGKDRLTDILKGTYYLDCTVQDDFEHNEEIWLVDNSGVGDYVFTVPEIRYNITDTENILVYTQQLLTVNYGIAKDCIINNTPYDFYLDYNTFDIDDVLDTRYICIERENGKTETLKRYTPQLGEGYEITSKTVLDGYNTNPIIYGSVIEIKYRNSDSEVEKNFGVKTFTFYGISIKNTEVNPIIFKIGYKSVSKNNPIPWYVNSINLKYTIKDKKSNRTETITEKNYNIKNISDISCTSNMTGTIKDGDVEKTFGVNNLIVNTSKNIEGKDYKFTLGLYKEVYPVKMIITNDSKKSIDVHKYVDSDEIHFKYRSGLDNNDKKAIYSSYEIADDGNSLYIPSHTYINETSYNYYTFRSRATGSVTGGVPTDDLTLGPIYDSNDEVTYASGTKEYNALSKEYTLRCHVENIDFTHSFDNYTNINLTYGKTSYQLDNIKYNFTQDSNTVEYTIGDYKPEYVPSISITYDGNEILSGKNITIENIDNAYAKINKQITISYSDPDEQTETRGINFNIQVDPIIKINGLSVSSLNVNDNNIGSYTITYSDLSVNNIKESISGFPYSTLNSVSLTYSFTNYEEIVDVKYDNLIKDYNNSSIDITNGGINIPYRIIANTTYTYFINNDITNQSSIGNDGATINTGISDNNLFGLSNSDSKISYYYIKNHIPSNEFVTYLSINEGVGISSNIYKVNTANMQYVKSDTDTIVEHYTSIYDSTSTSLYHENAATNNIITKTINDNISLNSNIVLSLLYNLKYNGNYYINDNNNLSSITFNLPSSLDDDILKDDATFTYNDTDRITYCLNNIKLDKSNNIFRFETTKSISVESKQYLLDQYKDKIRAENTSQQGNPIDNAETRPLDIPGEVNGTNKAIDELYKYYTGINYNLSQTDGFNTYINDYNTDKRIFDFDNLTNISIQGISINKLGKFFDHDIVSSQYFTDRYELLKNTYSILQYFIDYFYIFDPNDLTDLNNGKYEIDLSSGLSDLNEYGTNNQLTGVKNIIKSKYDTILNGFSSVLNNYLSNTGLQHTDYLYKTKLISGASRSSIEKIIYIDPDKLEYLKDNSNKLVDNYTIIQNLNTIYDCIYTGTYNSKYILIKDVDNNSSIDTSTEVLNDLYKDENFKKYFIDINYPLATLTIEQFDGTDYYKIINSGTEIIYLLKDFYDNVIYDGQNLKPLFNDIINNTNSSISINNTANINYFKNKYISNIINVNITDLIDNSGNCNYKCFNYLITLFNQICTILSLINTNIYNALNEILSGTNPIGVNPPQGDINLAIAPNDINSIDNIGEIEKYINNDNYKVSYIRNRILLYCKICYTYYINKQGIETLVGKYKISDIENELNKLYIKLQNYIYDNKSDLKNITVNTELGSSSSIDKLSSAYPLLRNYYNGRNIYYIDTNLYDGLSAEFNIRYCLGDMSIDNASYQNTNLYRGSICIDRESDRGKYIHLYLFYNKYFVKELRVNNNIADNIYIIPNMEVKNISHENISDTKGTIKFEIDPTAFIEHNINSDNNFTKSFEYEYLKYGDISSRPKQGRKTLPFGNYNVNINEIDLNSIYVIKYYMRCIKDNITLYSDYDYIVYYTDKSNIKLTYDNISTNTTTISAKNMIRLYLYLDLTFSDGVINFYYVDNTFKLIRNIGDTTVNILDSNSPKEHYGFIDGYPNYKLENHIITEV